MFVSLAWAIEASVAYLSGASVGKTNRYHRPLLEQSGVRRPYALLPRPHAKAIAMAVASCFVAHGALANPYGLSVVNGQVSARQNGNTLSITNSPGSIINWQGFSIGSNEVTRFIQQSAASTVLNRVVGVDPSIILGTLQSNGRVFLLNPNGVLFGAGSTIDVAGLVASTLNLSNADFLAGRMRFTDTPGAASVVNQGTITTPSGGQVYLVAPNVENHGVISSSQGEVILAAGKTVDLVDSGTPNLRVQIDAPDNQAVNVGQIIANSGKVGIYAGLIRNSGIIRADGVVRGANGEILLKATKSATVEAGSTLSASGAAGGTVTVQSGDTTLVAGAIEATGSSGNGGTVQVLGNLAGITDSATINVSGSTGGGNVLVGGDYQGANAAVQNAAATYFSADATINADATDAGNGGKVILWADNATRSYGSISARGGANGGDGGFVENSGKQWLDFAARVDTRAPFGRGGMLLLDPTDITISTNTTSGGTCFSAGCFTLTGNPATANLNVANLVGALGITSVTVSTYSSGAGNGDINVNAPINYNSGNALTLSAVRDINVIGNSIANSGTGALNLNANRNISVQNAQVSTAGAMNVTATNNLSVIASTAATSLSSVGDQTILARGIAVQGAASGTNLSAEIFTAGKQDITVGSNGLSVNAGAGGSGNSATIKQGGGANNDQSITVNNGGLVSIAGGGGINNKAAILNFGRRQELTFAAGGELRLHGGSGASGNEAVIRNGTSNLHVNSDQQNIKFTGGGSINITGGTSGTDNAAGISAYGDQTIRGNNNGSDNPNITLIGGASGGALNAENAAFISLDGGNTATQTINAHNLSLTGGAGGTNNVAVIGTTLTGMSAQINATGSVVLTGGAGVDALAVIGSKSGNVSIDLQAAGPITLTGGSGVASNFGAFALIGAISGHGGSVDVASEAGVTLTAGTVSGAGAAIGVQGVGSVSVTAGNAGINLTNPAGGAGVFIGSGGGNPGDVVFRNATLQAYGPTTVTASAGDIWLNNATIHSFGATAGQATSIVMTTGSGKGITIQNNSSLVANGVEGDGTVGGGSAAISLSAGSGGIVVAASSVEARGGNGVGLGGGAGSATLNTTGSIAVTVGEISARGGDGSGAGAGGAGSITLAAGAAGISIIGDDNLGYKGLSAQGGSAGYMGGNGGAATITFASAGLISLDSGALLEARSGDAYGTGGVAGAASITLNSSGNIVIANSAGTGDTQLSAFGGSGSAVGGDASVSLNAGGGTVLVDNYAVLEAYGGYSYSGLGGLAQIDVQNASRIDLANSASFYARGGNGANSGGAASISLASNGNGGIVLSNSASIHAVGGDAGDEATNPGGLASITLDATGAGGITLGIGTRLTAVGGNSHVDGGQATVTLTSGAGGITLDGGAFVKAYGGDGGEGGEGNVALGNGGDAQITLPSGGGISISGHAYLKASGGSGGIDSDNGNGGNAAISLINTGANGIMVDDAEGYASMAFGGDAGSSSGNGGSAMIMLNGGGQLIKLDHVAGFKAFGGNADHGNGGAAGILVHNAGSIYLDNGSFFEAWAGPGVTGGGNALIGLSNATGATGGITLDRSAYVEASGGYGGNGGSGHGSITLNAGSGAVLLDNGAYADAYGGSNAGIGGGASVQVDGLAVTLSHGADLSAEAGIGSLGGGAASVDVTTSGSGGIQISSADVSALGGDPVMKPGGNATVNLTAGGSGAVTINGGDISAVGGTGSPNGTGLVSITTDAGNIALLDGTIKADGARALGDAPGSDIKLRAIGGAIIGYGLFGTELDARNGAVKLGALKGIGSLGNPVRITERTYNLRACNGGDFTASCTIPQNGAIGDLVVSQTGGDISIDNVSHILNMAPNGGKDVTAEHGGIHVTAGVNLIANDGVSNNGNIGLHALNGTIQVDTGSGLTTVGGLITLQSDAGIDLLGLAGSINAGTNGKVALRANTAGQIIDIGGSSGAGILGISSAGLSSVSAGTLRIGDLTNTGGINVVGSVNLTGANTLSLTTLGNIAQTAPLSVSKLAIKSASDVTLSNSGNAIGTLAADMTAGNGTLIFGSSAGYAIGTADGITGISGAAVNLTADTLSGSGPIYAPVVNLTTANGMSVLVGGSGAGLSASNTTTGNIVVTGGEVGTGTFTVGTGGAMFTNTATGGSYSISALNDMQLNFGTAFNRYASFTAGGTLTANGYSNTSSAGVSMTGSAVNFNAYTPISGALTINAGGTINVNSVVTANSMSVTAGNNLNVIAITGPAYLESVGNQTISAGGAITVQGGSGSSQSASILSSAGTQSVTATNGISVLSGTGASSSARFSASGGQTIAAKYLEVVAQGGNIAQARVDYAGDQTITTSGKNANGEGLVVRSNSSGSVADVLISGSGNQSITVNNADAVNVVGTLGAAKLGINGANGSESLIVQGASSLNAVTIGSATAAGTSTYLGPAGKTQTITAGTSGQQGSINFLRSAMTGGNQTLSTTGDLRLVDATVSASGTQNVTSAAGLLRVGASSRATSLSATGLQTINTAGISLTGAATGTNDYANITGGSQSITVGGGGAISLMADPYGGATGSYVRLSSDAGNQTINFTSGGSINLTGGGTSTSLGSGNYAAIVANNDQTITGAPAISLYGGGGTSSSNNYALVKALGSQSITAGAASIRASSFGADNDAGIAAPNQTLTFNGGLTLNAAAGGGVRIGGLIGGTTSLALTTIGSTSDIQLIGSTTNGAAIGADSNGLQSTDISIVSGRDVILSAGSGGAARIGSPGAGMAGGNISITAGRNIQLTGSSTKFAAINTTGNVTLNAAAITDNSYGSVKANQLQLTSTGNVSLLGQNSVSALGASTSGGNFSFNDFSIAAPGTLAINGALAAVGSMSLGVAGNVTQDAVLGNITAAGLELLGANGNYTLTNSANNVAVLAGNTAAVNFRSNSGFDIGSVNTVGLTTSGNTTLYTSGTVTQSQPITASGLGLVGAGGSFNLASVNNAITTLAADTGIVKLKDNTGFSIGTVNALPGVTVSGSVAFDSTGVVTQSQKIVAPGLELLGAGGTYTLTNAANHVGTLATNTGSVSYVDLNALLSGTVGGTTGIAGSAAVNLTADSWTGTGSIAAPIVNLTTANGMSVLVAGSGAGLSASNTTSGDIVLTGGGPTSAVPSPVNFSVGGAGASFTNAAVGGGYYISALNNMQLNAGTANDRYARFAAGGTLTSSGYSNTSSAGVLMMANGVTFNGSSANIAGALGIVSGGAVNVNSNVSASSIDVVGASLNVVGATFDSTAANFVGYTTGNVVVNTGGHIKGNPDVVLAVGGNILLDSGGKIEAVSPNSVRVTFPSASGGGYIVNGVPGLVADPATGTGFYAAGLPASVGSGFVASYGIAPPVVTVTTPATAAATTSVAAAISTVVNATNTTTTTNTTSTAVISDFGGGNLGSNVTPTNTTVAVNSAPADVGPPSSSGPVASSNTSSTAGGASSSSGSSASGSTSNTSSTAESGTADSAGSGNTGAGANAGASGTAGSKTAASSDKDKDKDKDGEKDKKKTTEKSSTSTSSSRTKVALQCN